MGDIKKTEAAKQETEETTEFKNEIILNDVDEFCRAVSQANEEKKFIAERTQAEREREEKVKTESGMDQDVEAEYKKLKAQRMRERGIKVKEETNEKGVEREPLAAGGLAGALKVAS